MYFLFRTENSMHLSLLWLSVLISIYCTCLFKGSWINNGIRCGFHLVENSLAVYQLMKCLSTNENMVNFTMKYYPAIKKSEIMKFRGKLMELETAIISEVTRIQTRINVACFSSFVGVRC